MLETPIRPIKTNWNTSNQWGVGGLTENLSTLETWAEARYAHTPGQKLRWFKTFSYTARSWSQPRVAIVARTMALPMATIARAEVGPMGRDTCYIVTNLEGGRGKYI